MEINPKPKTPPNPVCIEVQTLCKSQQLQRLNKYSALVTKHMQKTLKKLHQDANALADSGVFLQDRLRTQKRIATTIHRSMRYGRDARLLSVRLMRIAADVCTWSDMLQTPSTETNNLAGDVINTLASMLNTSKQNCQARTGRVITYNKTIYKINAISPDTTDDVKRDLCMDLVFVSESDVREVARECAVLIDFFIKECPSILECMSVTNRCLAEKHTSSPSNNYIH